MCIRLAHALFQTSRLISSITKILSLLLIENAEVNPVYKYFVLFYLTNKEA